MNCWILMSLCVVSLPPSFRVRYDGDDDAKIKRCPMCHIPIERDAGCAQMMCKRCKHVFCWYCLANLDVSQTNKWLIYLHLSYLSPIYSVVSHLPNLRSVVSTLSSFPLIELTVSGCSFSCIHSWSWSRWLLGQFVLYLQSVGGELRLYLLSCPEHDWDENWNNFSVVGGKVHQTP